MKPKPADDQASDALPITPDWLESVLGGPTGGVDDENSRLNQLRTRGSPPAGALDVLKGQNPYQMSQVSTTPFKTSRPRERGQETLLLARRSLDGLRRSLARIRIGCAPSRFTIELLDTNLAERLPPSAFRIRHPNRAFRRRAS